MIAQWLERKFEMSRFGQGASIKPMEGLRGYAVFLVFIVHYVSLFSPFALNDDSVLVLGVALQVVGNTGVDLFFVLSGYLIYGTLIDRRPKYWTYFRRRVRRIYPVFLVVFALYFVLSFVFPGERKIPDDIGDAVIYLLQNLLLLPGLLPIEPMITVAWSLSYELFYYLMIPAVIEVFKLRTCSPTQRLLLFSLVAVLFVVSCAALGGPIRMAMFLSGILLFDVMKLGWQLVWPSMFGLIALVSAQVLPLLPLIAGAGGAIKIGVLFLAFFVLCLACFQDEHAPIAKIFSWMPMRWLGNMSYSYYLIHGLALKAIFMVLPMMLPRSIFDIWFFWGFLGVAFVLTLVPAGFLFVLVERPFSLVGASPSRSIRDEGVNIKV